MQKIEFKNRRNQAFDLLNEAAVLVMAQPAAIRNSDVEHLYRQESFFYYLTGFEEPESALLLVKEPNGARKSFVFLREKDEKAELWDGARLGIGAATGQLEVDQAFPIQNLWQELPNLIKGVKKLYYSFGRNEARDLKLIQCLKAERKARGRFSYAYQIDVADAEQIAGTLRLRKSAAEMERMREAARITSAAYKEVFRSVRPGMNERTVYGMLISEFMKNGSEMEAYGAIVAGGANACCLHYRENNSQLCESDLLLIDAGCQFQYYACDVTRTFPIGKTFTPAQRDIYQAVLAAQEVGIEHALVGKTMQEIHEKTCESIAQSLLSMKLLQGSLAEVLDKKMFTKFFPHGTGHWLGMDVHDVGDYVNAGGASIKLAEGMCFTIEPGIYIDANRSDVAEEFRGIGIRIEDDVHIRAGGPEILTADIPKKTNELENRY